MLIAIIVIAVLIVIIVLWLISAQRKLVNCDELCGNAMSQIGVQQNSRWDALTALAQLTKSYSQHEYETLMNVISQRKSISASSSAKEAQMQENKIIEALGHITAVAEAYPNLKADSVFIRTMDSVKSYEENVRMSRMVYNDTVTKFNRLVRQMPTNIAASIFHFQSREYLEHDEAKSSMPNMSL